MDRALPLKLGVLASGSGTNFEAIARAIAQHRLHAQIQGLIYNNPGAKAAQRAQDWNIPTRLINHRHYANRETFDQVVVETLRDLEVEWVVMAGWMRRATPVLVDAFAGRMLNIHPSLLPSFPGIRAVEQALAYGVKITGCTVHWVSLDVDSGPILIQAAVPIYPDDTADSLHQRIQVQEHRIIVKALTLVAQHHNAVPCR
nr:phosphoribosylglycinamide formyltransferase [Petrachloros mirabilis]